jgi:hypothetical protein
MKPEQQKLRVSSALCMGIFGPVESIRSIRFGWDLSHSENGAKDKKIVYGVRRFYIIKKSGLFINCFFIDCYRRILVDRSSSKYSGKF